MRYFLAFLVSVSFLLTPAAWAGMEMGQVPSKVELKQDLGGRLDGKPWSSDELKGKVHAIFYVDPDEKDTNNEASDALNKEKFPAAKFQSFGIINMAATWLPNFAISSSLEEKQKLYPTTIYVRDYKKVLVKAWGHRRRQQQCARLRQGGPTDLPQGWKADRRGDPEAPEGDQREPVIHNGCSPHSEGAFKEP